MNIKVPCLRILAQLQDFLQQIKEEDFRQPSTFLSGSSLGQHLRHTLEFFICLEQGFRCGAVNYEKRGHDKLIESDKSIAAAAIDRIVSFVIQMDIEKPLTLEVGYDLHSENVIRMDTNSLRELAYNIEHAVHHMAIMKIGIREIAPYIEVPHDFGVAISTIRYKEADSIHSPS